MRVEVRLLGGFAVWVDGDQTPDGRWSRRSGAALVKLLALSPGGRLHRDRVIDTLWPGLTLDAALPRLHKAAHYARLAVEQRTAVVLRDEVVALFPGDDVQVDVVKFEGAALAALSEQPVSPQSCAEVLDRAADLLPDDLSAPWLDEPRERLRMLSGQLARAARRWDDLLRIEPTDEEAHLELMRGALARGDRSAALRGYARMKEVLETKLGVPPSPEARAFYERVVSLSAAAGHLDGLPVALPTGITPAGTALLERDGELDGLTTTVRTAVLERRGVVILVAGEAGAGKSAPWSLASTRR